MNDIHSYYRKVFNSYDFQKPFMKWNWAAFFMGPLWLSYRGMHWYAVLYAAVFAVIIVVASYFDSDALVRASSTGLGVTLAIYGNYFYSLFLSQKYLKQGGSIQNLSVDQLLNYAPKPNILWALLLNTALALGLICTFIPSTLFNFDKPVLQISYAGDKATEEFKNPDLKKISEGLKTLTNASNSFIILNSGEDFIQSILRYTDGKTPYYEVEYRINGAQFAYKDFLTLESALPLFSHFLHEKDLLKADPKWITMDAFLKSNYDADKINWTKDNINPQEIKDLLEPLAEKGYSRAQVLLGWMYDLLGREHFKLAKYWNEQAAKSGSPAGRYQLAMTLIEEGSPNNRIQGLRVLKELAENDGFAQKVLGEFYLHGTHVPKNLKLAAHYFQQSVTHHIYGAYTNLAHMYDTGAYFKQDITKAIPLYEVAAENNDVDALRILGTKYFNGHGVQKDQQKAVNFFQRAVDRGCVESLFLLGAMYHEGYIVEQDQKKGLEMLKMAALYGFEQAQRILTAIEHGKKINITIEP